MSISKIPLPRTCKMTDPPMVGLDIEAHGRAMLRFLDKGLDDFVDKPVSVRRTWGIGKVNAAKECAAKLKLDQYGMMGPVLYDALWRADAYDGMAKAQLVEYSKPKVLVPSLVYIHDVDYQSYSTGRVHPTAGIGGNMALDFMAHPGTPVLAPQNGVITRTSGHNPSSGVYGDGSVFGWSIYMRVPGLNGLLGGFYYITHFGLLTVKAGQSVKAGQIIGYVGDWPRDRGRSHTHCGYTSFTRLSYLSTRQIQKVAAAPRVAGRRA